MRPRQYYLNLAPVTKKNHQRIIWTGGHPRIAQSEQYLTYEARCLLLLAPQAPRKPIGCAVNVQCLYYMPTRRKVDLTNLLAATDDILVRAGILEDDNSNIVVSHDGSRVLYDKTNPRTEIVITEAKQ